ncbi:MAG: oxidoreductase [Pseudomonadota bacterium]
MTERHDIGVGLIGYGLGGRAFHAPYVGVTPGMSLRAVVSRDAAKVHADLPQVHVVPDVAALLAEPGIDLVVVSSPDELHAEHAAAAIRAGRHVLIDKPFATKLSDAYMLADLAADSGVMLTAFQNRRWDADFLTLRGIIDDGLLGEVVQLESRFDRWRPGIAPTWKDARAGGSWLDLGPHLVDQALVLFGRPQAVTADLAALRDGAAAPDWFHVVLRYPDRRVILQSSKLVADHGLRFAVHGTRGSWIKHGIDPQEAATVAGRVPEGRDWGRDPVDGLFTGADGMSAPLPNVAGDYRRFWTALASAIRGTGANPVPASDAIATMEVLDAGLRSAGERREVAV